MRCTAECRRRQAGWPRQPRGRRSNPDGCRAAVYGIQCSSSGLGHGSFKRWGLAQHLKCTQSTVGVSLLAIAVNQSTSILNVSPSSRAGSLLQGSA
ncbi:hypothetical protein FJD35_05315 [Pseudomonas mandelii]|nr:hypothetical protein FJD35_05315 [Pseudomonas mandelii]